MDQDFTRNLQILPIKFSGSLRSYPKKMIEMLCFYKFKKTHKKILHFNSIYNFFDKNTPLVIQEELKRKRLNINHFFIQNSLFFF